MDGAKSDVAKREEAVLVFWKENKIFEKSLEKQAPKGEFVFYDGPPFATGLPHSGSLLSSVSKDVIPRYKTMRGYRVHRRWGWDTHGLPIESLVEKKLGLKTKKDILTLGVKTFNETARSMVLEYVHDWKRYVERVGRWVDFDNSYKTMDNAYIESVWWALSEIHKKGNLYEGRKVLMYCPHDETPLAKAEIAMDNTYKDITEEAVTVKFKVKNPEKHGLPASTYLLAWTTTPWTLPGNVALAVGKDIEYGIREENGEHLISAGAGMKGSQLIGIEYEPLYEVAKVRAHTGKKWVVLPADFVTTDEGTGIVHTAVIYGEDDYKLGLKEGLPMVPLLTPGAMYNDDAPEFVRGKYIKKAEADIKADLETRGLLYKKEPHTHAYPHCYRCGTPLIYNAVSSWFINIQSVKQTMLAENEKVNWFPEHLKHGRFKKNVEAAPDWTISRNRFWASPLPIWKDKDGNVTVIGSLDELKGRLKPGSRLPQNDKGELDLHLPYIDEVELVGERGEKLTRVPEVVDCWVESASMPFATHSPMPGDFVSEYIGQTRAWFYYMHAMSAELFGRLAFRNVITTGNIVAADGEKLSKSKKNYTDPYVLFDQFGADAFRYYLMSSVVMQAEDLMFRDEDLKEVAGRVVNILRNTHAFYELYKEGAPTPSRSSEHVLDRWILARLDEMLATVTAAFDHYDIVRATRPTRDFVEDFSTWYVRRSRERVKGEDATDKAAALATMRYVLREFSKIIAPVMPFIAEEIFRSVKADTDPESVHLAEWPRVAKNFFDFGKSKKLIADMKRVREVVSLALEARAKANIKVRQPLARLTIPERFVPALAALIKDEVNVKEVAQGEFALDITLTDALRKEGEARDVLRAVQDLRKQAGLAPQDKAVLVLAEGERAYKAHQDALTRAANIEQIEHGDTTHVRKA